MDNKEIRAAIVAAIEVRMGEIVKIKADGEALCVGILVDSQKVISDIPDAKALVDMIIDEIDDRTNTGIFDVVDGALVKGLFDKFGDTPRVEKWFADVKAQALAIIAANVPKV